MVLFAAANELRVTLGSRLTQTKQARLNRALGSLRARIGDEAFESSWGQGGAFSLEQAVGYASGGLEPPSATGDP